MSIPTDPALSQKSSWDTYASRKAARKVAHEAIDCSAGSLETLQEVGK